MLAREQVGVTLKIQAGCTEFIRDLAGRDFTLYDLQSWRDCCSDWKQRYPVAAEPHEKSHGEINYYHFADSLSNALGANDCVVADAGSAFYVMGQALRLGANQRFLSSGSLGSMGYALPAANGAAATGQPGSVVCVTGDGSLMTNLHELATMKEYNLEVKLFVINNDGYVSMRNTQRDFCDGHYVGADSASGVYIPPIDALARSFELPYVRCSAQDDVEATIRNVLAMKGPVLCEVIAMRDQKIIPAVISVKLDDGSMRSAPLHNMFPHISEETLMKELNRAIDL